MKAPRLYAALFVLLLITSLSLVGIGIVGWVGPALSHGANAEHASGKIIALLNGKNFVLKTDNGKKMTFVCNNQCRASLGHLQRHLFEQAHTDVYYIHGTNNLLVAVYVD